ncbi:MAG TPA: 8-amino-7-oxononanoate synthase [Polyangiaceae bacterium]
MSTLSWIGHEVAELRQAGLLREVDDGEVRRSVQAAAIALGVPFVDGSSNDYLGMGSLGCEGLVGVNEPSDHAKRVQAVSRETRETDGALPREAEDRDDRFEPPGAAASRLLGGTRSAHVELERHLADWVGQPEALLFSSGYSANLGMISAVARRDDVIFSDSLNHASIVDGCRLSRARTAVFRHLDLGHLSSLLRGERGAGKRFVVTESYFSMDGDSPDLGAMRDLCDAHEAVLVVDEAHALGVFGRRGGGLAREQGARPDIVVGTLGKAVGLHGAFVASSRDVKEWLWNRARSFVYSTAMAPSLARQLLFHVKHVQCSEHLRLLLTARVAEARRVLEAHGVGFSDGCHGPILPIIVGSSAAAKELSDSFRANGILTYPVRPPTVPEGTSRLRFTVSAGTSEDAFAHLLKQLARLLPTP